MCMFNPTNISRNRRNHVLMMWVFLVLMHEMFVEDKVCPVAYLEALQHWERKELKNAKIVYNIIINLLQHLCLVKHITAFEVLFKCLISF